MLVRISAMAGGTKIQPKLPQLLTLVRFLAKALGPTASLAVARSE